MLRTVRPIFIVTSLILGVFLYASAFAASVSITAGGTMGSYNSTDKTLTIPCAFEIDIDTESDFNLLNSEDTISLIVDLGSGNATIIVGGLNVIEAVAGNDVLIYADTIKNIFDVSGSYTISGGTWKDSLQTDFLLQAFSYEGSGAEIYLGLNSVPIPASLTLIGLGLMMLTGYRRKLIFKP